MVKEGYDHIQRHVEEYLVGFEPLVVIEIFFFSIYLVLPAALGPGGVYSASNRNEYHKQKTNISGE
jgi:hypothetical protein